MYFVMRSIICDTLAETRFRFPRRHGTRLHRFVSVVVRHSLLDKILQQLSGKHQSMRGFQIAQNIRAGNTRISLMIVVIFASM